MSQLIVFLALVFSVIIAIFAVQNTTAVDVQFLGLKASSVAVSVLVLVSAVFGAVAMLLLGAAREVGLRWQHRTVTQQLRQAKARVAELESSQTSQPKLPGPEPAVSDAAPSVTPTRAE